MKLAEIQIHLGALQVLAGASLSIGPGVKAGLTGVNGAGKTTLMQVAAGRLKPEAGTVERAKSFGYLSQEPDLDPEFDAGGTVRDVLVSGSPLSRLALDLEAAEARLKRRPDADLDRAVEDYGRLEERYRLEGGYRIEADAGAMLNGLGIGHVELDGYVDDLSSGERTRLEIARVLMGNCDLLLLDEPTNHLDENGARWLMDFLANCKATVLLISHDMRLLDGSIARVFELDAVTRKAVEFKGTYSAYLAWAEQRQALLGKEFDRKTAAIGKLQVQADRFRGKTEKMARRAKVLDRRVTRMERELPRVARKQRTIKFSFSPAPRSGRTVLTVTGLCKSYGSKQVLSGVDLQLERGQRAAVIGVNGAGKSTLLRIVAGRLEADAGGVEFGYNVSAGFYSQEVEDLEGDLTAYEQVTPLVDGGEAKVRSVLGQFLISSDHAMRPARTLSGGEKVRLAIAKLMLKGANLLVLDEPTSNLDAASRARLLDALDAFGGTVMVVSHDRRFISGLQPDFVLKMPGAHFEPFDEAHLELVELA